MILSTGYYRLEYKDAAVRWIKSGDVEIIRMIYSAVRDHNWGTLTPEILEEKILQKRNGFEINVLAEYKKNNIHFEAQYQITGQGKSLSFEVTGTALTTFNTCRVGICVLHPIKECAGKKCHVIHHDNTPEDTVFPIRISPSQPAKNIKGMKWAPSEGIQAELNFSGDVFEMEDQRNWTDASYKTYCRPLSLPFPFEMKKNEKVNQKVELLIQDGPHAIFNKKTVEFKIDKNQQYKIPNLGTCVSSREEALTNNEIDILRMLPFDHLRYEVKLYEEKWKNGFQNALQESYLTGWRLFLVLYFSENYLEELKRLKHFLWGHENHIGNVLIIGKDHLPNDKILGEVYDDLKVTFKDASIGTGVNAYFAELNRNRPKATKADFVSFTVCPQVHASDDDSLIENLEAQKYVVDSAKKLFPAKPIYISPVTLKQRFNIVATSNDGTPLPDQLPVQVDNRQNSIFAAQWLLGSLKYLSQSGAGLVTFFETVGWRGIIQGGFEPSIPEKFNAQAGDIFPIYYLLKEFVEYKNVIYSESSAPLCVEGIVLQNNENKMKLLMANFCDNEKSVELESSTNWNSFRTLPGNMKIIGKNNRIVLPPGEIVISEGYYFDNLQVKGISVGESQT